MKESELNEVREEYQRLVKEKETLLSYKKELLELINDKKVKRYLELINLVDMDYKAPSEEYLIERAYRNTLPINGEHTINSNQIMVYMGTYIEDKELHKDNDYITFDGDPKGDYKAYLDLETQEAYNINLDNCEEFENEYLTIYTSVPFYNSHEYNKNYFELKKWFHKQLITRSQKEVITEIQTMDGVKYRNLYNACHKYPAIQLNEKELATTIEFNEAEFVRKHPENGFVEKFCLSKEEQIKIKAYRRQLQGKNN